MVKRDYYIILGVARSESPAGIHEAFRKLAKKYHPDLGGPEATETFQEIAQAYEVLSDPEQRRTYDQSLRGGETFFRSEPLEQAGRQGSYRPEPLVPQPMSILHDFQTIRPSFDALFDRILQNFSRIGVTKAERIEDLNIEVILTPMEAARGVVAPIEVPVFRTCWSCQGSGREWLFTCMGCAGQGMIEEHETVSVRIPPGVRDRSVIELPIEGLGIHNFYLRLHIRISG
jgi:DnaJ-class molecular chaperone